MDTPCHEWIGGIVPRGYGQVTVKDPKTNKPKTQLAHRVSYVIHNGKIPKGLEIHHVCENIICVNPNHLKAITHKENMVVAGKSIKLGRKFCPQGMHKWIPENIAEYGKNQTCKLCVRVDKCFKRIKNLKWYKVDSNGYYFETNYITPLLRFAIFIANNTYDSFCTCREFKKNETCYHYEVCLDRTKQITNQFFTHTKTNSFSILTS